MTGTTATSMRFLNILVLRGSFTPNFVRDISGNLDFTISKLISSINGTKISYFLASFRLKMYKFGSYESGLNIKIRFAPNSVSKFKNGLNIL